MSEPKFVVCSCNVCSGSLEFDASQAGTTIQCPHCGMDTILFEPAKPVEASPPPSPPESTKPKANSWWKPTVPASMFIVVVVAVVGFLIYKFRSDYQKAERNAQSEMADFQLMTHPTLAMLQTNGLNQILEDCSNEVVGLHRIVKAYVVPDGSPSNWWGVATVEFVNTVGGIERKERWYVFDTDTNDDGTIHFIFAHEDPARFDCDELKDASAEYKMGIRYLNGDRVPKDVDTAKEYFQKAAAQGNQDAISAFNHLPP
jgi:DNA-directed RNA polymerase subunit RPC12/RpoP